MQYSGEDANVVPILALGGMGVISVAANIVPADVHKMVHSFMEGDIETSRRMQIKLEPLVKALFCETNPIPVKAAMNLMGMNVGRCRLPLVDISPQGMETLKKAMKEYGLL